MMTMPLPEPNSRLEDALARLGADHEPPAGWEARVLAAVAPRRRSWWWPGAPLGALAVVAALLVLRPSGPDELVVDVVLDGGPLVRGNAAHIGQVLHAAATGGGDHRALWIYRDDKLVVACPRAPRCRGASRVELELSAIGSYVIVAVSAGEALPEPTGTFDTDIAAALGAGAHRATTELTVR
jgi:hypothetical protein